MSFVKGTAVAMRGHVLDVPAREQAVRGIHLHQGLDASSDVRADHDHAPAVAHCVCSLSIFCVSTGIAVQFVAVGLPLSIVTR
jgi:hypothetical protein